MRWQARVGERLHHVELTRGAGGAVEASVDGRRYALSVTEPQSNVLSILADGVSHEAIVQMRQGRCSVRIGPWSFEVQPELPGSAGLGSARAAAGAAAIRAVMPGRVLRVPVKPGDKVTARQGVVVVEAMKMENEVTAPRDGLVKEVRVSPGATVETGQILVILE
jgi:biotin carboxyl carrier protein